MAGHGRGGIAGFGDRPEVRLGGLRLLWQCAAALPAFLAIRPGVQGGVARMPYLSAAREPVPWYHLVRILHALPSSVGPMILLVVLLAILGDQFLTAGACALLDPVFGPVAEGAAEAEAVPARRRRGVLRIVREAGARHLARFLVLMGLCLVLLVAGIVVVVLSTKTLTRHGEAAGWTASTLLWVLPAVALTACLLWTITVGAWFFWCRITWAALRQRRETMPARRSWIPAVLRAVSRNWRQSFLRTWGAFVAGALVTAAIPGTVLFYWRQCGARSPAALWLWGLLWLASAALQSTVWVALVRSAVRLNRECSPPAGIPE